MVLEEPFSLGYPYVFEADGNFYMMPETSTLNEVLQPNPSLLAAARRRRRSEARGFTHSFLCGCFSQVRLYQALDFPYNWVKAATIISGNTPPFPTITCFFCRS